VTYVEKLNPWCVIRHFPNMQHQIVSRFRRRNEAEAHLQTLRRLMPDVTLTMVFFNVVVSPQDELASK
jgi:hypothetical protein